MGGEAAALGQPWRNGQHTLGGMPGRTGGVAPGSRTALIRKVLFIRDGRAAVGE